MNALNIKITEQNGQFRRFTVNESSYALLIDTLRTVCGYDSEVLIQTSYRDDEGDEVVFASDEEYAVLIALFPELLRIKVSITEKGQSTVVRETTIETIATMAETDQTPFSNRITMRIEKIKAKIADGSISEEKGKWLLEKLETKLKEGPRNGPKNGACGKGRFGGWNKGPQNPELNAKFTEMRGLMQLMKEARQSGDKAKVQELKGQIQPLREEIKALRQKKLFVPKKESSTMTNIQELRLKTNEAKIAFREAKQRGESKERIAALREVKIEMWKEWKQEKMALKATKNVV